MEANKVKFIITVWICHILWVCQVLSAAFHSDPCGSVQPFYGMMLKGHVFQSMKTSNSLQCLMTCDNNFICQSFNYVVTKEICELNNRTSEAAPEDLVPDKDGFYMKRFIKRVRLGSISELPAKSCKEIKSSEGEDMISGYYWLLFVRLEEVVQAFCDMLSEDLDECSASKPVCHVKAQCQNNIGSYNCSCNDGYVGDGLTSCEPEECHNYQSLTSGDRKNTYGGGLATCDYSLAPGWYRFQGAAGSTMATTCVATGRCGTHAPGWLNGAHPTVEEEQATRQVCFHYYSNCCVWSINVYVRNCGGYFVYYINRTPPEHNCELRYCGAD
ncbi:uncharacterized protein LOC144665310 isoform X2 [Oculina patagonica]